MQCPLFFDDGIPYTTADHDLRYRVKALIQDLSQRPEIFEPSTNLPRGANPAGGMTYVRSVRTPRRRTNTYINSLFAFGEAFGSL